MFTSEQNHFPKRVTRSARRRASGSLRIFFLKKIFADFGDVTRTPKRHPHIAVQTSQLICRRLDSRDKQLRLRSWEFENREHRTFNRASISVREMIVGNSAAWGVAHVQN